jgi:hypothetical protein
LVKEQLRALLATGSLADAAVAKSRLQTLVEQAAQPETNRLWRTVCRWWKEIEVLIVTGATTAKVEPTTPRSNTSKEHAGDSPTHATTKRVSCCAVHQNSGMNTPHGRTITTNREESAKLTWAVPCGTHRSTPFMPAIQGSRIEVRGDSRQPVQVDGNVICHARGILPGLYPGAVLIRQPATMSTEHPYRAGASSIFSDSLLQPV